jgi:hypothetical protein
VRAVKLTLGVSIALIAIGGALTLTRSPPRVVRVGVKATSIAATIGGDAELCQANETLPAGASAIRLAIETFFGAKVRVKAYSGARVIAEGRQGADWTGSSVTVPITPLRQTVSHVKICATVGPTSELVAFLGTPTSARESAVWLSREQVLGNEEPLGSRLGVEYLAAGRGSWWSRILEVARHMGIGHALSGTWVTLLIAALMAAVGALAIGVTLRGSPR